MSDIEQARIDEIKKNLDAMNAEMKSNMAKRNKNELVRLLHEAQTKILTHKKIIRKLREENKTLKEENLRLEEENSQLEAKYESACDELNYISEFGNE